MDYIFGRSITKASIHQTRGKLSGFMFLFIMLVIIVFLSVVPASEALHSLFQDMDRNGDGRIDQNEFSENMIEYAFNKIDDNDSGVISKTEWDVIESVQAERERNDELVKAMDMNNDSSITFNEFSSYAKKHSNITKAFMTLDNDKNGVLSPVEIPERPLFIMVTIKI